MCWHCSWLCSILCEHLTSCTPFSQIHAACHTKYWVTMYWFVQSGGPFYDVLPGRRGDLVANQSRADDGLPSPFRPISSIVKNFADVSLDIIMMDGVMLSGAGCLTNHKNNPSPRKFTIRIKFCATSLNLPQSSDELRVETVLGSSETLFLTCKLAQNFHWPIIVQCNI